MCVYLYSRLNIIIQYTKRFCVYRARKKIAYFIFVNHLPTRRCLANAIHDELYVPRLLMFIKRQYGV